MKSVDLVPHKHYMGQLGQELSASKSIPGLHNAE